MYPLMMYVFAGVMFMFIATITAGIIVGSVMTITNVVHKLRGTATGPARHAEQATVDAAA